MKQDRRPLSQIDHGGLRATAGDLLAARASHTYLLLLLCLITITVLFVFAKFVTPPLIERAYRGESFSFLNSVIHGQQVHSVAFYLQLWDDIARRLLVSGLVFWLLAIVLSSRAFLRFVGDATPGTLG